MPTRPTVPDRLGDARVGQLAALAEPQPRQIGVRVLLARAQVVLHGDQRLVVERDVVVLAALAENMD